MTPRKVSPAERWGTVIGTLATILAWIGVPTWLGLTPEQAAGGVLALYTAAAAVRALWQARKRGDTSAVLELDPAAIAALELVTARLVAKAVAHVAVARVEASRPGEPDASTVREVLDATAHAADSGEVLR